MNLRVKIISEACEWFGVNPMDITSHPLNEDVELNSNEKMAITLICDLMTSNNLSDYRMSTVELAKYFNIDEQWIIKTLNNKDFSGVTSGSYSMVKKKLEAFINNYTTISLCTTE